MPEQPLKFASADEPDRVLVPDALIESAKREHPLLRGLMVVASGFSSKVAGCFPLPSESDRALVLYCANGSGWCEAAGRLHAVRQGDVFIQAPGTACTLGTHLSNPWAVHWAQATGSLLSDYLKEVACAKENRILRAGEDPQFARLFNEIHRFLRKNCDGARLLCASHAFAFLLALLIEKRRESAPEHSDNVKKVAEVVIYMSEHLKESLRVSALARLVSLSPTYFGELFKEQTGCSPRDYLHLLRIHRACQLLRGTALNVKEIATQVGYQDQFHFSRQFKAFQGVSPSEYRSRSDSILR